MPDKEVFKPGNRKYIYAVGRRKEAVAQVRLYAKGSGKVFVNGKSLQNYLPTELLQQEALKPLLLNNLADQFDITVVVRGGGVRGQAEAIRLGVARALVTFEEGYRSQIKKAGLLTRDARVKERKKYGLKRARRAPQWSKR